MINIITHHYITFQMTSGFQVLKNINKTIMTYFNYLHMINIITLFFLSSRSVFLNSFSGRVSPQSSRYDYCSSFFWHCTFWFLNTTEVRSSFSLVAKSVCSLIFGASSSRYVPLVGSQKQVHQPVPRWSVLKVCHITTKRVIGNTMSKFPGA